jgi:hypothetical protein
LASPALYAAASAMHCGVQGEKERRKRRKRKRRRKKVR